MATKFIGKTDTVQWHTMWFMYSTSASLLVGFPTGLTHAASIQTIWSFFVRKWQHTMLHTYWKGENRSGDHLEAFDVANYTRVFFNPSFDICIAKLVAFLVIKGIHVHRSGNDQLVWKKYVIEYDFSKDDSRRVWV